MSDRQVPTWITETGQGADRLLVRSCRLTVQSGVDAGKTLTISAPRFRIGARPVCDFVLSDPRVSGFHFEISLEDDGYRLRDLGSTNGTFVGQVRIAEGFLQPGTTITVGSSQILFEALDTTEAVELAPRDRFGELVGRSQVMRALFAQLEKVSQTEAAVLIGGETGSGKELVAEAIHNASPRRANPFVVVDCGAISPQLIASELFGHEKGAFTGAEARSIGAFERAHGGTIFLDEIGELPLELQPTLLGVLERRRLRRVGGSNEVPVDVRVVAATHRDLAREMNSGRFREDLYYRLAVVKLSIPPLRKRLDDIPLLVPHLLQQIPGGESFVLKQRTLDKLSRYEYPGNVRELRNILERAVALAGSGNQTFVGKTVTTTGAGDANVFEVRVDATIPFKQAKGEMVAEFEQRYFRELIEMHEGNVSAAARAAGLDRMTVHKMLQRYDIDFR